MPCGTLRLAQGTVPKGTEPPRTRLEAGPSGNAAAPRPRKAGSPIRHSPRVSPCVCQAEVCAGTVAEVIQSVVNGADGCVFCFGHAKLGQ